MSVEKPMADDLSQSKPDDTLAEQTATEAAADAALGREAGQPQTECDACDPTAAELTAEKDRVLRLQAEMENLRGRTAREIADQRRYGSLPLVRDLLPVLDNVERAIEAAEENAGGKAGEKADVAGLVEGFKLVRQQLLAILEQHHCQRIEAVGQPFDPRMHEAILQQPSDEQPKDHVLMETQVGYRLHDRVVRASQVIVSAGPAAAADDA